MGGVKAGPGPAVGEDEELERVIPAIEALRARFDIPLSVDTWSASVAREAYAVGAVIGNDISGFADPDYLPAAAAAGATVVATHIRLGPRVADPAPFYEDVVHEVGSFLVERADRARAAGLSADRIVLDAGLDLGKTADQSLALLRGLGPSVPTRLPAAAVGFEQDVPRSPSSASTWATGGRRRWAPPHWVWGWGAGSSGCTTWHPTGRCARSWPPSPPPGRPRLTAGGPT